MSHGISNDAQPHSELEVAPSERTIRPAPQHLRGPAHQNTIEHDGADKQAREYAHETSALIVIPAEDLPDSKYVATNTPESATSKKSSWRQKKWIIPSIVTLFVIVAAVVGGVAGGVLSKHAGSKHPSDSNASPPPSPPPSPTPPTMSGPATALASYGFPTAVSWGYPHMEIFALNSSVYPEWKHRPVTASTDAENGGWEPSDDAAEPFIQLDGKSVTTEFGIASTTRCSTIYLNIFITGADQHLYQQYHNTTTSWAADWFYLAGSHLSPPTAVCWAPDRLDIFTINSDYVLSQIWYSDSLGWQPYFTFASAFSFQTYAPTVVSWAENRYDIFLVGSEDQALYHKYFDGNNWEPPDFENLGGFGTSRPVAVCRDVGKTDIFVRGGDAGLWHMSYSQELPTPQQWSNWTSISGGTAVQAEPEAVKSNSNTLHVFAWGGDNTLLYKVYDAPANSWTPDEGFDTLGQGLSGPPKAVYDGQGVHVFVYLESGQLGHKSLELSSNAWSPAQGFELLGSIS